MRWRKKPPLGAQGEVARSAGGDQSFRSVPAYNPSVALRAPAPLHRGAADCQKTSQKMSGTEQRGVCAGGKKPTARSINRILKLFESFKIRTAGRKYFFDTLADCHAKNSMGSTGAPSRNTAKCTWGAAPTSRRAVVPTVPKTCPAVTNCPAATAGVSERLA